MKASTVCLAFSVLFSAMVSANGVIPVIDLDFTRSADQTLKKLNINDACIIAAATPMTFTYCREGSLTLWKYQALDMEQQPIIHTGAQQSPMALGRISVVEVESAACLHEYQSDLKPVVTRRIVLSLIALFLLIGSRYAYKVIAQRRSQQSAYSEPFWQQSTESEPAHHAIEKAVGAFAIAAVLALVYGCCSVI